MFKIQANGAKNKDGSGIREITLFLTNNIGQEYQHLSMAYLLGEAFAYILSVINETPKTETELLSMMMSNARIADAVGVYTGYTFAGASSSIDDDEMLEIDPMTFEVVFRGKKMKALEFADEMHGMLVKERQENEE